MALRMDNGPELISQVLQRFCAGKIGLSYIPDNREQQAHRTLKTGCREEAALLCMCVDRRLRATSQCAHTLTPGETGSGLAAPKPKPHLAEAGE